MHCEQLAPAPEPGSPVAQGGLSEREGLPKKKEDMQPGFMPQNKTISLSVLPIFN